MKSKLSTLWVFILFNSLFRDVHELFRPGVLEEMQAGVVNGTQITEELMLVGGAIVEIPILMVLLSVTMRYTFNRWANMIVPVLTIPITLLNGVRDMDDAFFMTVVIVALMLIFFYALKWKNDKEPVLS